MQMPARTPAMTAMTAMTLDALSGGRFILGIGPSGPQVVEGWHGVAYGKPLLRTREYIEIIRKILERNEPLTYAGEHYQIPFAGPGATGLGKPLKSIMHGNPKMKIYTASIAPASIRNSAEVADGMFPRFMNPQRFELFEPHLNAGFAKTDNQKSLATYDVCPFVPISMGDDLDEARLPIKQNLALYIGGMGARRVNYHHEVFARMGYEAQAATIQDHYLAGDKKTAIAAVPTRMVEDVALIGPWAKIADELPRWRQTVLTTFSVSTELRHLDAVVDLVRG
jgi:F420-dependent oxidoreductase-like protein